MNIRPNLVQRTLRGAAATLLQIDQPVPPRTDAEIEAEVQRNYRWNFAVNLLDGASFWFGLSFISSSTIAALYVSKLTTSPLLIGLVAVIAQGSWFLPQLFTANFVERLPRRKPVVVNLGFFLERVPLGIIVVSAVVAGHTPALALALFFLGYTWHGVGAGLIATSWQDLIARCFPVERRGRFFGITMFVGAGTGVAGAALSTWLLKAFPFSTSFVYIFAIAAAGITVSWFFLALTREPVQAVTAPRQSNREFLAKLPGIVRRDHNFRRFLIARSLIPLGGMGVGFVTVAAVRQWQVPDGTVGLYTATYLLGQTVGNPAFGFLADRFGHKLSLEVGALASALAFTLAWLAPSPEWFQVVFFLLGINLSAVLVSGILVVLEFSEPQRRPTYVGMANTAVGLVSVVAPLLGAWLAGIGYSWLFAASAATSLVALVAMRWWVQEPRWTPKIRL
jgi:MFS family permease